MNISGKVFQILPEASGEGRNGPWSRQDFIIETDDQYPKKVCISVWNGKVNVKDLSPGVPVDVEVSVESREYNGRWYTDVKASGMTVNKAREETTGEPPADRFDAPPKITSVPDFIGSNDTEQENDLPF